MTGPWPADARYLQLADLTVDLHFRRLSDPGQSVELPQRVFDLLLLFLAEPGKLHTRTELFERLWAGTIVEDTNLSQNIWLLRKALGEERKSWIRTVAKSGYVFQAPEPLRWFTHEPPAAVRVVAARADDPVSIDAPAERGESGALSTTLIQTSAELIPAPVHAVAASSERALTEAAHHARRRYGRWLAVAALTAIAIASLWFFGRRSPQAEPRLTVAVVTIEDQNTAVRWPAKLLEQWLGWKLGSLPHVNVLSESDLAAGNAPASARVVFLSSVPSPGDPAKVKLYVRFQEDGQERRLEAEGRASDMPALVDSMSRQILARLQPAYDKPWPALEIGADAAQRYTQAVQALDRRDWMTAAALGQDVVARAPRFGLMRLQLAQAQARLFQAEAAIAQMDHASRLLAHSPPPVVELLRAQRLAIDPRRGEQALAAYAKLVDRYPDKASVQLEYARLLLISGKARQALTLLGDAHASRDPMGVRIGKQLLLAEAHGLMGDLAGIRVAANEALRLARGAGAEWNLEQADALLSVARADKAQFPERGVPPAYEQAAVLYEKSGNPTGALRARVMARLAADLPLDDRDPDLESLLARANSGGYWRLEINVLVASADQHARVGDIDGYRSRLTRAAAAAAAAGDLTSVAHLDMRLLHDDILSARLDHAAARLERLRKMNPQGNLRVLSEQGAAGLSGMRGGNAQALEILDRAEGWLPPTPAGQAESETHALLACARLDFLLPMGRLAQARENLERCVQGERKTLQSLVLLGRTQIELLGGDRARALEQLAQAERILPTAAPESWLHALEVARLATRLGETERSQRLYAQALPQLQPTGYSMLIAMAAAGQAENAAARGDWARSREFAANARRLVPPDAWVVVARLDLLAAADARRHGERAKAQTLASALHQRAKRYGDVAAEMEVHQLFEPGSFAGDCSAAQREALVARTGMRGVDVDWLRPAVEARGGRIH